MSQKGALFFFQNFIPFLEENRKKNGLNKKVKKLRVLSHFSGGNFFSCWESQGVRGSRDLVEPTRAGKDPV